MENRYHKRGLQIDICGNRFGVQDIENIDAITDMSVNMSASLSGGFATSSPGKRGQRKRSGGYVDCSNRHNDIKEVNKKGIYGTDEEEMYSSGILSPIRIEEDMEEDVKVTSMERSGMNGAPRLSCRDDDQEDGGSDMGDFHGENASSDADVTIQRVREFIENKRRVLVEAKRKRREGASVTNNIPQREKERGGTSPPGNSKTVKLDKHQRKLRQLVHKIHKQPFDINWSTEEWNLFRLYLKEWKLSGDDKMLDKFVVEDLFNCTVDELHVRLKSLKRFIGKRSSNRKLVG